MPYGDPPYPNPNHTHTVSYYDSVTTTSTYPVNNPVNYPVNYTTASCPICFLSFCLTNNQGGHYCPYAGGGYVAYGQEYLAEISQLKQQMMAVQQELMIMRQMFEEIKQANNAQLEEEQQIVEYLSLPSRNECEEVCRCDDEGCGDPPTDTPTGGRSESSGPTPPNISYFETSAISLNHPVLLID